MAMDFPKFRTDHQLCQRERRSRHFLVRLAETLLKLTSTIALLFSLFCWKSAGIMALLRVSAFICLLICLTSVKAEGSTQSDTEISESFVSVEIANI